MDTIDWILLALIVASNLFWMAKHRLAYDLFVTIKGWMEEVSKKTGVKMP